MWEVDIRTSADGVPVVHHDATLAGGRGTEHVVARSVADQTPDCPDLSEVVALAAELGAGIYADIKDADAAWPPCIFCKKRRLRR